MHYVTALKILKLLNRTLQQNKTQLHGLQCMFKKKVIVNQKTNGNCHIGTKYQAVYE